MSLSKVIASSWVFCCQIPETAFFSKGKRPSFVPIQRKCTVIKFVRSGFFFTVDITDKQTKDDF